MRHACRMGRATMIAVALLAAMVVVAAVATVPILVGIAIGFAGGWAARTLTWRYRSDGGP